MTVTILEGDVRAMLRTLEPESVHCIWTSIPYWGLRSYGTVPQIWGGDETCQHEWGKEQRNGKRSDIKPKSETTSAGRIGSGNNQGTEILTGGHLCHLCGAWRGEHGLEPTLGLWLQNEVVIWRELRRVLRKDGVAWLNCGDAYATAANGRSAADTKAAGDDDRTFRDKPFDSSQASGLKSKQRLMLPARVALALQSDGWWLRDEIVWFKANPMPSSVQDRTTPAHEMLYMLTRSARYYYDNKAIMEPMVDSSVARLAQPSIDKQMGGAKQDMYEDQGLNAKSGSRRPNQIVQGLAKKQTKNEQTEGVVASARTRTGFNERWDASEAHKRLNTQSETLVAGNKWGARHEGWEATKGDRVGRNKRSVWPLATEPFPDAHFATAPTALVEPCLKAGTSEKGCCPKCGAPWVRVGETTYENPGQRTTNGPRSLAQRHEAAGFETRLEKSFTTKGWKQGCDCNASDPVPCTVIDPFFGSGTTGVVADRLRLNCIGIELNPEYAEMARARLKADGGLFMDMA